MTDTKADEADEDRTKKSKALWHTLFSISALLLSIYLGATLGRWPPNAPPACPPPTPASTAPAVAPRPTFWVYSHGGKHDDPTGILRHVHLVLDRVGYVRGSNDSDWDLLWAHDYPFRTLGASLRSLRPHQLVNHFPGIGHLTLKVDFATGSSPFIPRAFRIPENGDELLCYASEKPETLFVLKDNQHRRVFLKNISEIDLAAEGNFVQEYVADPFLVDGHKFDIGVYTILTSVDPLRAYIYKGDVLFRYCPTKYYPFDPLDVDKYVIGDDYLPTWELPSLAPLYTAMGYGMKDSFDAYAKAQGKDPTIIWEQIDKFLGEIFLEKEHLIIAALKNYRSGANFFEMMRFDFVVDSKLRVYALEANMSPNLSSAHYPPNRLLYEQLLYSALALAGVARYVHAPSLRHRDAAETAMRVADKNLGVWAELCSGAPCRDSCSGPCASCRHCLSSGARAALSRTVLEQLNRRDCRRVFPPPMVPGVKMEQIDVSHLSPSNQLLHVWLQGKCNIDVTWCN